VATNRNHTFPLNRSLVTDEQATQNQKRLDAFLQEPFANIATSPLVFGPVRVHNNVFTSLFRVFRVMPGTAVVVVGNGQVLEILTEGSYHALSFPVMNRIDLFVVNVRERTLTIETTKEFNIFYQPPEGAKIALPVDLSVAVTYQVTAPDRVALFVEQPITMLYDTVLESMRAIVAYATYQDFQAGGQAGYMITQQLQNRGVQESLGIRIANVQITSLAGAEELEKTLRDVFLKKRQAQTTGEVSKIEAAAQAEIAMLQAATNMNIARMIEITPQYLLTTNPEMYSRVFGDKAQTDALRLTALTEMAKAGMLPLGSGTAGNDDLRNALLGALTGAASPGTANPGVAGILGGSTAVPALPPSSRFPSMTARERLQDEVRALLGQTINTTLREDMGAYYVTVNMRDSGGHTLDIYFACTARYPQEAPTMFVEIDGATQNFMPLALSQWTPQNDLLMLVESVLNAYS
jgi:regulator of protease activity HflC (stomatin/prohibitin superfamily)